MKNNTCFRGIYLLGLILIVVLLGTAFFLQTFEGMIPCPLCLLQRITMVMLSIIFLAGTLLKLKKWGNLWLGFSGFLIGACGILLSGRQVWLQLSPPVTSGDCGANLSYLLRALPIQKVIQEVWQGGMECSQTGWEFLHLSLAAWSLVGFTLLLLLVIVQLIRAAID